MAGMTRVFHKALALSLLLLAVLSSCTPGGERLFKKSRLSMDTIVTITVASSSETAAEAAIEKAFTETERLAALLSYFSENSEVTAINRSAGVRPVVVSRETFDLVEKALYVSEKTGGAFDITVGPLMDIWNFHDGVLPPDSAVQAKRMLAGYRDIKLDSVRKSVFLMRKGMKIDLGGIAKGYIADKVVEVLKKTGIKAGVAAMAGDIKTFGKKPDGKPWKIGVKNPRPLAKDADADILAAVSFYDSAISTAGDYERYFIKDGIRYHHILDPKTGYPAGGCRSVSVIAADGVIADGFDNGIFVLGPLKGMSLLKSLGIDGIIVDSAGAVTFTDGLKGKIEIREK